MDETFMLVLLSLVMLIGSYIAGNIPLVVNLSERKLKVVTIFGAGLLVGTALTVIIPEGVNSLYSQSHKKEIIVSSMGEQQINEKATTENTPDKEYSSTIGLSLVLGFVFMMVVDQISSRTSHEIHGKRSATATIGLVVHAAADGVALGAAATTSHHDVEMIVFFAIMLHKAPAAFGLVSFLLHEGVDRQRIRKHLGIFSLSAPLLTLITYFCIGQEQKQTLNEVNATGIAMLFSAGTFLYVATVHVLPELTQNTGHSHGGMHGSSSSLNSQELPIVKSTSPGFTGLRNSELIILICGALMPLLLTVGHHH
uniref:CSON000150 protein n=1 Tax=Culicoides sonorensis TaxID=179676 RepID=A0A336K523_CULSO